MTKNLILLTVLMVLASILSTGCSPVAQGASTGDTASASSPAEAPAADSADKSDQITCAPAQGETAAIAEAKLYVEYNSTDEDLGIHGCLADNGWSELCVYNPSDELILAIKPQAQLKDVAIASVFFEGREPSIEEFSFEDLKSFPEGQYKVRALSYDGTTLVGEATFSRDVPAPPTITFPALAEDTENAKGAVVSTTGLVIGWEDVTGTIDGSPVTITAYEVIITKVDHDDPHGFSQPIYDVHVPVDQNSLPVPVEFLEPDTVYELEVLALEESGNQTITVGFFTTADSTSSGSAAEFAGALPKIEYNAMAGDLGFHVELDGDPFKQVTVLGPDGNPVFDFKAQGSVAAQGLTSFAFESAEPPLEELPLDEFQARFPEGDYTFTGTTIEGGALENVAEFTHLIPDPPQIISPDEGEVLPLDKVVIAWEPVISPDGIEIDVYLVQLFPVDPPEGQEPIDLNIDLLFEVPAFVTEVQIPPEFLTSGAEYQYEVTAVDEGGNQTLTGGTFVTVGPASAVSATEIAEGTAIVEYNSMEGLYGFHVEIDSPAWNELAVSDPDGNAIVEVRNSGLLGVTGVTNILMETLEPPLEEQSRQEFLARYVEGEYAVSARTVEGELAEGTLEFSHNIPDPPQIISPGEGDVINREEVVISWEPMDSTDVEIVRYSVNVFPASPPEGQDPIELDIDYTLEVPASITEVRIPPELLVPGVNYLLELTAIEDGGNGTITIVNFMTAP